MTPSVKVALIVCGTIVLLALICCGGLLVLGATTPPYVPPTPAATPWEKK